MSSGNFLFIILMVLGPMVSISSSSWLICWVGIELSFMGIIPILLSNNYYFSLSKESTMKYFCIQALSSGLLLCGGLLFFNFPYNMGMITELIFMFSLLLKLGVFPGHFWVPSVVSGLDWVPMLLMLTWQKIPPFFFLVCLVSSSSWMCSILLVLGGLSALIGGLIGLNQTKLGPMLGASSISHSGWVVMGSVYGNLWMYFLIYCVSLSILVYLLMMEDYFLSGMMILSLSGLPPFVLFLGKWSILKSALGLGFSYWFICLPLFGSIMSLFFYLKFFYSFYLEEKFKSLNKLGIFSGVSSLIFLGVSYITLL
uniref:NADH dehydrogenase subunit 2 n=1 Tax=Doto coronata TaxID=154624 RepID=UPI002551F33A|nr:NADH dehydrogenase subunit 2 [Doto coronata]WGC93418.1 NADH dehydrogenase subunit 2 [Doto coronata]